jgi:hypothetical protein
MRIISPSSKKHLGERADKRWRREVKPGRMALNRARTLLLFKSHHFSKKTPVFSSKPYLLLHEGLKIDDEKVKPRCI